MGYIIGEEMGEHNLIGAEIMIITIFLTIGGEPNSSQYSKHKLKYIFPGLIVCSMVAAHAKIHIFRNEKLDEEAQNSSEKRRSFIYIITAEDLSNNLKNNH